MKDMILEDTGTVHLEDLEPGMARHLTKTIGEREIQLFAEVSEDRNPIHLCDEAAGASIFGQRIAHGMLSASLFSAIIGERLPGHGTIYLGQNLRFKAPVRIGDTVTAEVRVADIDRAKKRVTLHCTAWVGDIAVIEGDALVLAPSRG
jgi:3-hydroxybutyryl-CoA dehydratase